MEEKFTVYWYDYSGFQMKDVEWVSAEEAMKAVSRLIHGPAKFLVYEVLVVDTGDMTNFHWSNGEIIFPKKEDLKNV